MKLEKLLTGVLAKMITIDRIAIKKYTKSFSSISSGGNLSWQEDISPADMAGYYPVGVVGFNSYRAKLVVDRAYIENRAIGSCTIRFHASAFGAVDSGTAFVEILWIKAE